MLFLNSHESVLSLLYAGGIVVWLLVWRAGEGYRLMRDNIPMLWLPFLMCLGVLFANLILWRNQAPVATLEVEESLFNFLDARSANTIAATGSVLVIATIIYGVRRAVVPKDFIRFEALAFICLLGVCAPIIWIPPNRSYLLMILRHYQTIPFTYGLFLAVSGIIVLLHSLGVEITIQDPE